MTDDEIPGFLAALGVPGIVDAHVHFLPDSLQEAVWRWFDRLTPRWPVTYRLPVAARLAVLAEVGVRHHTALAYPHCPGMLRLLNDHTLGLAAAEKSVIPTFTIFPEPGVGAETARCLEAGGRAVKVHLQVGGFDATDPLLDDAWDLLQAAGSPVIVHAGAVADGSGNEQWCGPEPVRRLLGRFPSLRLVIAHLGAPDHDGFFAIAEQYLGVWLDAAMICTDQPYLGPSPLHLTERMAALGDRIVFGSDFPAIPHAFAAQLSGLVALGLGDEWLRKVLWHNGLRLFGLERPPDVAAAHIRPKTPQKPSAGSTHRGAVLMQYVAVLGVAFALTILAELPDKSMLASLPSRLGLVWCRQRVRGAHGHRGDGRAVADAAAAAGG
jgi:uncharacterized protein